MAWRTIAITNPARLRIEASQLVVAQETETALPLEDVACLILECPQVTLSAGTLSRLAEHGTMVLVCGAQHTPVLACLPYAGHSRLAGVHRLQLATTAPFRKRCWQRIVREKILNQAEVCRLAGRAEHTRVEAYAARVASGDTGNMEGVAAREHFALLFGPGWNRGGPDGLNSALDYGYAVLRAAVVRALAAHGFLLTQGLHHCSELNPFNLADDFLEPLRPAVDLYAAGLKPPPQVLEKEHRVKLVELLGCEVLVGGKRQSILNACQIMAGSFLAACKAGDAGALKLPQVFALTEHRYE